MPIIDDFELPDILAEELEQRVKSIPDEVILSFAQAFSGKLGGFRIIKKNCEQFRKRIIKTMLSKEQELPLELVNLFALEDVNQNLIAQLPVESLEQFHNEFLGLFGLQYYLNCLLLDDREMVRKIAIDWIRENEEIAEEESFDNCKSDKDETVEVDEQLLKEFEEIKIELRESKKETLSDQKKKKKLQKKIDDLRGKCDLLNSKYSLMKSKTTEFNTQLTEKEKEINQLQKNQRKQIDKGIAAYVEATMNSWLSEPIKVEKLVKESSSDLFDRVANALSEQAKRDKHSGNIKVLKEKLVELKKAKTNIDLARKDALQPLPELALLSKELTDEIDKIGSRIKLDSTQDEVLTNWQAQINDISSLDELHHVSDLIQNLHDANFLSKKNCDLLRHKAVQTRDRLIDNNASLMGEVTSKILQKKETINFIIDGHNVILSTDSYYLFNEQNNLLPENDKRQLLIKMNKQLFTNRPRTFVRIFFDSPVYSENQLSQNIIEIYSGGGSKDQRADIAIIQYLQQNIKTKPNGKYVLVTDDIELATNAESIGAQTMSVFDYGIMLR